MATNTPKGRVTTEDYYLLTPPVKVSGPHGKLNIIQKAVSEATSLFSEWHLQRIISVAPVAEAEPSFVWKPPVHSCCLVVMLSVKNLVEGPQVDR